MTSENLDFNRICRICCAEGHMMSVFKVHIHKKLMACASVQVWQNDGLPSQICNKCIAKLHISFQFKKLCEKSDSRLRNYLADIREALQQATPQLLVTEDANLLNKTKNSTAGVISSDFVYVESCDQNVSEDKGLVVNQRETPLISLPIQPYTLHSLPSVQFQTYNLNLSVPNQTGTVGAQCPPQNINVLQQIYSSSNQVLPALKQDSPSRARVFTENGKLIKQRQCNLHCSVCAKKFGSNIKLNRHMKTHSNETPFRCKICHKGFTHSGNFKVHMRMHNDERPYQCSLCDRACRQQQDLEKHMRTHTGERPHVCQLCSKAFSTSSNLIAHSRTHSGEKPYVCSICQKAFCQSNELTKHLRSHTGEKSHTCKLCNKGFNGSSTLVVHMRSHTGERPYTCNMCNKTFTQSSCLQVHLKRHSCFKHNAEIVCEHCDKRFHRASDFNKHLELHTVDMESSLNVG